IPFRFDFFQQTLALGLSLFTSAEVMDHDLLQRPAPPIERHGAKADGKLAAVPGSKCCIDLRRRLAVCDHGFPVIADVAQGFGRDELENTPTIDTFRRSGEHLQHRGIRETDRSVSFDYHDTIGRKLGQEPVAFFALAQRLTGHLSRRYVAGYLRE